jgi:Pentapeptide repeats (8 copies)
MNLMEAREKYNKFCEEAKQHPEVWILFGVLFAAILLLLLPPWQVSQHEINNATKEADLENQYRATLAQIIGGFVILFGLYFTWGNLKVTQESLKLTRENAQENLKVTQESLKATQKSAQDNLEVSKEGQITERFARAIEQLGAIDHLGNLAIEVRLGGIYALEKIANESEYDYWPIIEILTAYVRLKSCNTIEPIKMDIQTILTVLGRRRYIYKYGETERINLSNIHLDFANLEGAKFSGANLKKSSLIEANFKGANLEGVHLEGANLQGAFLSCSVHRHTAGGYINS